MASRIVGICVPLLLALEMSAVGQVPEMPFALGVEYMVPGFAEVYARTGVRWAKAMGQGFSWGDIERTPPVGSKHVYNWTWPDQLILEYQRAGFHHFHIYVKAHCRWGSSKPIPLVATPSFLPKAEYMDDYAAFVRALVERYDNDGHDDVPGLLYPVEYWEIEAEWGTFWPGTAEEYLQLLKVAHSAVKSANPKAKVILIGFFMAGVFEGQPDPQIALEQLAQRHPPHRVKQIERGIAEAKKLFAHPELFDVIEFHSLSDWSEIPGMSRFLRHLMRERGYQKPIWVGDVNYTASPMMFWGEPVPPYTKSQKAGIEKTLRALANSRDPRHGEVVAWFRAEQSKGLVKKVVLAMAEGLAGINIGNLKDEPIFSWVPTFAGSVAFQGLVDSQGIPAKPGEPRPAYHALTLLQQKLGAFVGVETLNLGPGVYAYKFMTSTNPLYILWYDDRARYLPGDKEPSKTVNLPWPWSRCLLTETPVSRGPIKTQILTAQKGFIQLELSTTPIWLEPRGG